jgi:hypothetical protein
MASTYLSKTFSSAGNKKTWTFSAWLKIAHNDSAMTAFYCGNTGNTNALTTIRLTTTGLRVVQYSGGSTDWDILTNRQLRDFSAFYHIVVGVDTTQATAANRVKVYINGTQQTSLATSTYPSQNYLTDINSTEPHTIGRRNGGSDQYFDGSMSHVHFIDGTQYAASDFGETESTSGIWKPKVSPSVTYGTNGFFLKFQDSSSLGDDSSGNTNDFTLSGSGKQILDTPSNVFCTWNSLEVSSSSGRTFSNANTTVSTSSGNASHTMGTFGVNTGKWYYEVKVTQSGSATSNAKYGTIGFHDISEAADTPNDGLTILSDSRLRGQGSTTGTAIAAIWTSGDILQLALDLDNGNMYVGKNGNWYDNAGNFDQTFANSTAIFTSISTSKYWTPCVQKNVTADNVNTFDANFGNGYFGTTAVSSAENDDAGYGKFEYDVPAGYYAWNTKNINNYG